MSLENAVYADETTTVARPRKKKSEQPSVGPKLATRLGPGLVEPESGPPSGKSGKIGKSGEPPEHSPGTPGQSPQRVRPKTRSWRKCAIHPKERADTTCPICRIGFCLTCKKPICPACDAVCMKTADYEAFLIREKRRAQPLGSEIGAILSYPLQNPTGFILMALFTGGFSYLVSYVPYALLFSKGVLLWYCFHAISEISRGNLKSCSPNFSRLSDLARPLRLSSSILVITWGPLILLLATLAAGMQTDLLTWGSVEGQEAALLVDGVLGSGESAAEDLYGESEPVPAAPISSGVLLALGVAFLWKLIYTPVALIVAALSGHFLPTINPFVGLTIIKRMGAMYGQAMLIYTGLAIAQWIVVASLSRLPMVGVMAAAFANAYFYLAIGCVLGLAVFKRAEELDWD